MTMRKPWRWLAAGGELSALATAAASTPLGFLLRDGEFDPAARHPTPVVLVHGLLGNASNFLFLRRVLAARGIRNLSSFSYLPSVDVPRVADRLADTIQAVSDATGGTQVDVVGHSFGGLVARYMIEMEEGRLVRRLVTLGSPCFTTRLAPQELALFAAADALVRPLHPIHGGSRGRTRVLAGCGHVGLLYHPAALREVTRYLACPVRLAAVPARQRAVS